MSSLRLSTFIVSVSTIWLTACGDPTSSTLWETPSYTPNPEAPVVPQKDFDAAGGQARGEGLKFDPRVDILFIIDNSESMAVHQQNLRRNINQFVNSLGRTKVIDFQIGVTTVHDSFRYGSIVKKECGGKINFLDNGELAPLKGAGIENQRFVTRDVPNYLRVLEDTLNVGIAPFVSEREPGCKTGPEHEESFSPILESFNEANQTGPNKGFWRPGSLKVIMLVTDAFDSSPELQHSPSLVIDHLYRLSESTPDDQKFRIYAVTAIPGQSVNPSTGMIAGSRTCRLDFGFKPQGGTFPSKIPKHNVAELVELAGGRLLSICQSNYGAELAKVGEEIRVATSKDIVYDLPHLPDRTPERNIRVWFHQGNNVSVALEEGKDWVYDAQRNRVIVDGLNLDWDQYPDAYINVDYIIYNPRDLTNQMIQ